MTERGMAEVVDQGQRLHQIDIEIKGGGDGARNLRDFDGVRQAGAEVVGIAAGEDLGFVLQTTEGARVDDAVPVALKRIAVGMRRLREAAPARVIHANRVAGQHKGSVAVAYPQRRAPPAPKRKAPP